MSVEYDESLREFLLKNGFTFKNIVDVCIISGMAMQYVSRNDTRDLIKKMREHWSSDKSGVIFTLPGNRRDNHEYLCSTHMTGNEIRRIVALMAFL